MGSVEGVADEKSQIFAGLEPGGAAILPEKDDFYARLKAAAQKLQPSAELLTLWRARAGRRAQRR